MKYSEEVKALLHKARRSLDAAKELFSKGYYDFAVSRAYYAMFYSAEAVLLTKDLKFKKHSAVISMFGKEFVKTGKFEEKYHGYLLNAFREREKGDYDVFLFQGKEGAEEVLKNAEEFISAVEGFLRKLGYELKEVHE